MTVMTRYYLSRTLLSAGFAALFVAAGSPWWMAVIIGVLSLAFFAWAPRSGRYLVQKERGITALRSDERSRGVRARAAGIAFIVAIPALGALVLYYSSVAETDVPTWALSLVIALGATIYVGADIWFRRSQSR